MHLLNQGLAVVAAPAPAQSWDVHRRQDVIHLHHGMAVVIVIVLQAPALMMATHIVESVTNSIENLLVNSLAVST